MRLVRDMIYLSLTLMATGCSLNKNFVKNYEASGSPCMDGTLVNIMSNSCNSLYWGVGRNNEAVKFRCTNPTTASNMWNTSTFYGLSVNYEAMPPSSWTILCADQVFAVFIKPLEVGDSHD